MPRHLDATRIVETSNRLAKRVAERFPQSSLSNVAKELESVAVEAAAVSSWLAKPIWTLRALVASCLLLLVVLIGFGVAEVRFDAEVSTVQELVPFLESLINNVVFVGIGVYFLVGMELRIKRDRAQKALHVLRSLAHIVDMHQLTKDPERLLMPGPDTESSPRREMSAFELTRYLDYCSEILSLISKIAAVYVQHFEDAVVVSAASDVEALTGGLSRKVWQKIMLLDRLVAPAAPASEHP